MASSYEAQFQGDESIATVAGSAAVQLTTVPSFLEMFGDWEAAFIDDLVAANRFKTFLASKGTKVPEDVSKGLAQLSEGHQNKMSLFIRDERKGKHFLRSFMRSPEDLL